MGTVDYTDEALLLSGDLEDFGRFYDRYVRSLLAFFQRRTRDPEVAADLTAETFAAAMVARGHYRGGTDTAAGWLFGIAQHKLADFRRRGAAEDRMRERLGMQPVPVSAEDRAGPARAPRRGGRGRRRRDGSLTIPAPPGAREAVTALTQPGHVAFYDWERSVLGPRGEPAPQDSSTTGGPDAGRGAAVTKAEAEARAAAAPGGRVVRAENGDGWFALGGAPPLTDADIAGADSMVIQATQHPIVVVELTTDGQAAFSELTRELAQRGARLAGPGSGIEATQHLAIVIDDQIVAVPFIDFRVAPNGIDGSDGAQISGNLTAETARQMASVLDSGPLPGALTSAAGG